MPGSTVNSTRLGRGPGNKKGKTAGRGTKGQNARAGGGNAYFEGGQTPIHIRFPKVGHNTSYTSCSCFPSEAEYPGDDGI